MFLKVNTEEVANIKEGGSKFINESGIYPLTIKNAAVSTSKGGSTEVSFGFEDENNQGLTIYGLRITKNDGSESFGMDILKSLVVCAGLEGLSDPQEREVKIGKDGKETKTLNVLEDLDDVQVRVRLRKEYHRWNGKIQEKFVVVKFYNMDKLSGSEIAAGKTIPAQYEKDELYANKDKLKDGITEEEVAEFVANKGKDKTPTPAKPKPNPFNKK